jgi:integrase
MSVLTSDTPPLSRPINEGGRSLVEGRAINCTPIFPEHLRLPSHIADLVRDSLSANSRRAYASDVTRFAAWGGAVPATPAVIAEYLADHADSHAVASLIRWLTSLAKAHRALGAADPTDSELVKSVLRGIRRRNGSMLAQAKPLLRDDLFAILDAVGGGMKADRDRALLLIGFAGGFRRSELVGLDVADAEPVKQGIIITIRRSKTDQLGIGRKIGIPYARGRHCPIAALDKWRAASGIADGPVFRPVTRHGQVVPARLSGEAVSLVIKERLVALGIEPNLYSGHSLRAGFVTSAAQAGVSSWKIREQTGHKSEAMLARYIRDGEMFLDNAAGALL